MDDRNVEYPFRFELRPVPGTDNIVDLIPAPGIVYNEGTLINKATLWKDVTAALFGLGADSVPDDGFVKIKSLFDDARVYAETKAVVEVGSYQGTNVFGLNHPSVYTFAIVPKFIFIPYHKSNSNGSYITPIGDGQDVWSLDATSITTNYAAYNGFGMDSGVEGTPYGKKSSDGKTFSWYNTKDANAQFNMSGFTYTIVAIG